MKSKTRLDSAVFQLTPTRTRYTLVVNAKGKTEQISSGLLGPFLEHLKAAKDQVSKGCYSILLQPDRVGGAVWFTKGTVERFVRFVNTPEVLERVNMTESEILQIEEAISIQDSDTLGLNNEEDHNKSMEGYREKSRESIEGSQPLLNVDIENMIVIYKLGEHITSNGSTGRESSRVHFLRVLETRKTVLQKEQGMAFARALAAGFDMDHMSHLVSFAECFGAPRLMEACVGFMVLWKRKHEHDHWLENGAMPTQSEVFADTNLKSVITKQHEELKEPCSDSNAKNDIEGKEKSSNAANANMNFDYNRGYQEFCQPMQDVPYHQINMGGGPLFQPLYPHNSESLVIKHLKDNKSEDTDSEMRNMNVSCLRQEEVSESSQGQEQRRKSGRTSRKKSGVVVIRNLNYISSERMHDNTVGGSQSTSDPENVKEADKIRDWSRMYKKKKSVRSIKSKESITRFSAKGNSYEKEDIVHVHEADSGNWQVFQNILLQHDNRDRHDAEHGMFASEKDVHVKRLKNSTGVDPVISCERNSYEVQDGRRIHSHINGGKKVLLLNAFSDDLESSRGELGSEPNDCLMDIHFPGSEGGKGGAASNRKMWKNSLYNVTDESYILPSRSSLHDQTKADFSAINMDVDVPSDLQKKRNVLSGVKSQLSYEPDILSLVPIRETVPGSIGYDPSVDCEVQASSRGDITGQKRTKEASVTVIREMPKKLDKDKKSRAIRDNAVTRKTGKSSKVVLSTEAQQARAEKIRSSKADLQKMKKAKEEEELKRLEALKNERQKRISARSSSGPAQLTLTQTRPQIKPKLYPTTGAPNLNDIGHATVSLSNRTASMESSVPQNTTKPNNLNKGSPSQSTLPSQLRPQLQSKLSPTTTYRSSKFSDSEPGPSSPLQRLRRRAASLGSNAALKMARPNGSSSAERYPSNKPIHSASSLPNLHKPNTPISPDMRVSTARVRKLSYPSVSSIALGSTNSSEQKVSGAGVQRPTLPEKSNRHNDSSKLLSPSPRDINARGCPNVKSRTVPVQNSTQPMTSLETNSRSSPTVDDTQVKQSNTKSSHNGNGEDKQVIETTVVLENEIPIIPIVQVSQERIDTTKESFDDHSVGENTELVTKYETTQTPVSPAAVKEVEIPIKCNFDEKPCTPEIEEDHEVKEQAKCTSVEISPEPHQTPPWKDLTRTPPISRDLARRTKAHGSDFSHSSVDISSGPNHALWQELERTPPNSSDLARRSLETTKAHTPGGSPGSSVKARVKLSSKGIRRILRFGKSSEKQFFKSDSRIISKSYLIDSFASTASSYKGRKLEENGYRRSTMSHALYIA
ncbi:hypothetical protein ACHQM5_027582 [Ranunculus cassubicifolius]